MPDTMSKPMEVVDELNMKLLPGDVWKKGNVFSLDTNGVVEVILYDGIYLWDSEEGDRFEYRSECTPQRILHTLRRYLSETKRMLHTVQEVHEVPLEKLPAAPDVCSAHMDVDHWVLTDEFEEPVEWPENWPDYVTADQLREAGVEVV